MTRDRLIVATGVLALTLALAPQAAAQDRPAAAVEGFAGHASFLDDSAIGHSAFGGAARWYLLPRIAVGPELVYMIGPGDDRDFVVTGNVTFDLLGPTAGRPRAAAPFFVVGGGLFHHSDRFGGQPFSHTEGSVTAGGGVRVSLGERLYVAPEFRIGWEPHYRITVVVGWRLGP